MIPKPEAPQYGDYRTSGKQAGPFARLLPTWAFYIHITRIVLKASRVARKGNFTDEEWYRASLSIRTAFEKAGADIRIEGTRHLAGLEEPAIIIGNHMSTAETFLLASIILPFQPVTFVVKRALVEYPVFKHIMLSRNPIVVGRVNPRDDLKAVLGGGQELLQQGVSIIIFPQRTRTVEFDRESFNTIGVKLAKRSGAPVIPLALKTNAWSNGKLFKDYGRFRPGEAVCFEFGPPMRIDGNDREVHEAVADFIESRLREWGVPVK